MGFWSTGTKEVLIGTTGAIATLGLVALVVKNSSGISKLIGSYVDGANKILKTVLG